MEARSALRAYLSALLALAERRNDSPAPALRDRPSLRRPIRKPRKIVVKGALRTSLLDPCGTPDHDSWRGFTGAYRSDGMVRALTINPLFVHVREDLHRRRDLAAPPVR